MATTIMLTPIEETIAEAAQAIGQSIALEVGRRPEVEKAAIELARHYAVTAGDSLGASVHACLVYGNAVAAAFDSTIRQMAVVAIVKTFRNRAEFSTVAAVRHDRMSDRRVWKGRLR
jgi:hypothetical protein